MDDKKIVYDSNEITNILSKIVNNTSIIENDVLSSINNDFNLLHELNLFSDGLNKLADNSKKIVSLNNRLSYILNDHDLNMNALNKKHIDLFNNFDDDFEKNNVYDSEIINIDEISVNKITDGKLILKEYVNDVLFSFNYDRKLEILNKILKDNSLSIITDNEQSDILIYQLKDILKDKYSMEFSKLSKEEEIEIQRDFFKSISSNDKNIFNEIKEDSLLHGLSYFNEVSEKNNISVESLLFDEKNNELFVKALSDIYKDNQIDSLTVDESNSVKNYINNIATSNNIEVFELLKDEKYSSVLKGGIFYEN